MGLCSQWGLDLRNKEGFKEFPEQACTGVGSFRVC